MKLIYPILSTAAYAKFADLESNILLQGLQSQLDAGEKLTGLQQIQYQALSKFQKCDCVKENINSNLHWMLEGKSTKMEDEDRLDGYMIQQIINSVKEHNRKLNTNLDEPRILNLAELAEKYGDKVVQAKFENIKIIKNIKDKKDENDGKDENSGDEGKTEGENDQETEDDIPKDGENADDGIPKDSGDDKETDYPVSEIKTPVAAPNWAGVLDSKVDLTAESINFILDYHNDVRSKAANGSQFPGLYAQDMHQLVWDADLAKSSQIYANYCNFKHTSTQIPPFDVLGYTYGENLAVQSSSSAKKQDLSDFSILKTYLEKSQQSWYDEVNNYSLTQASDQCQPGEVCGHYTQMIWADTTKIGCGVAKCDYMEDIGYPESANKDMTHVYLVCQYHTAGNYVGQQPFAVTKSKNEKGMDCVNGMEGDLCLV